MLNEGFWNIPRHPCIEPVGKGDTEADSIYDVIGTSSLVLGFSNLFSQEDSLRAHVTY